MLYELLTGNVLLFPETVAGGSDGAAAAEGGDAGPGDGGSGEGGVDGAGSGEGDGGDAAAGEGDGATGEGDDKDAGQGESDEGKPNVPESYDLKLPEETTLNDDALTQISERAKELGLTQEQAEKLLEQENTNAAKAAEQQKETWKSQVEEWGKAVKSDKEIGGDNYDATVKASRQAVDKFASPELKKALNETGFGNHPELVRCFAKIGRAMGEEAPVNGSPGGGKKDTASILYPNDSGGE